jgi:glycine/D-amino acid oxidase-like deaminating enzyme
MLAEASLSFSWFEDFIQTEGIDADYQRTGRFVGAHCSNAWQTLAKRMAKLNEVADSSAYMLPAEQTREEIGSDYYKGGMVLERSGAVHPGKLHRGVLNVARSAGVKLFGNVRAGAIAKRADGLRLETSRGPLMADKIIIATNGYTGDLSAWHQRRVVPIASYQVATEELGSEMVTQLFPKHRMIADTKRLLYYFRPSPDRKRLLFGGRARYLHHDPTAGGLHLRRKLTAVFPQLADVKLSHGWWGYVAYLRGGVPDLGESQPETLPGVYHALGCHGSGVVMMSWLGYRMGLLVSGQANSQSAFSRGRMVPFPLYQEKPWFLPIIGAYYQLRDWTDRRLDDKFPK